MGVQEIVDGIVSFVRVHQSWAIPIAFLVAFGESVCFLSLVWPGTAILVGITALFAASGMELSILWPSIIAAALGGSVGYAVSYWVGVYFKDSVPKIWPFSTHPHLIPQGQEFFQKWGAWGVFFGHFFGPVRAVIPVVAGMFRMPQIPFQIANFASAFIWAAGVIAPAFFLVTFKDQVFHLLRDYQWLVLAALFVLAVLNAVPTAVMAVPTLALFVGLGALFIFAGGDPLRALAAGALGAWLGDLYVFNAGRGNREVHLVFANGWSAEAAEAAQHFVMQFGLASVIPSKFHTTLRAFAPITSGALGLAVVPFALLSALSAVLWASLLLVPVPLAQRFLGW